VNVQIRKQLSYQLLDKVQVRLKVVLGQFIVITLPEDVVIVRNPVLNGFTHSF
jgi:hypothetical protein